MMSDNELFACLDLEQILAWISDPTLSVGRRAAAHGWAMHLVPASQLAAFEDRVRALEAKTGATPSVSR